MVVAILEFLDGRANAVPEALQGLQDRVTGPGVMCGAGPLMCAGCPRRSARAGKIGGELALASRC